MDTFFNYFFSLMHRVSL